MIKSRSQAGQDLFVHEVTNHKQDGIFVDIGCNDSANSNTLGLEEIGWRGLLCDLIACCQNRKAKFLHGDARKMDWKLLIGYYLQCPARVDYLSIDTDECSLETLKSVPLGEVRFGVITIEHDKYRLGDAPQKGMRSILSGFGYDLVCSDVVIPAGPGVTGCGGPFEDWWVYPSMVNDITVDRLRCDNKPWMEII